MNFDTLFWAIAFILSSFYGLASFRVFTYPHTDEVYKQNNLKKFDVTKRARFHEAWTHFICSLIGWLCMYVLYVSLFRTGISSLDVTKLAVGHFLLLLIGLLGIIGFLPRALWNFSATILELTKKITGS